MPRLSSESPSRSRSPRRRLRRVAQVLFFVYLVLLAGSHAVRHFRGSAGPPPAPGMSAMELPARAGDEITERSIRLAYARWGRAGGGRAAVLLLHGSPGRSGDFRGLGPLLGERYYAVAPDLPGFGRSTRRVPDYSIRAHASYALALLDELGIEQAHVVGFSMGGGVALHLADQVPERVLSVTLLSAIGLQEFELLGQYHLNHAVHGLQLAGLWLLYEGFPHFGWLDGGILDVPYARNFYDTDQRPLRPILESLEHPLLVIHGERDVLVPIDAAREHHRRVPQSELVVFPGANHFMVFTRPADLEAPLRAFFERVERGEARRRSEALPERVAESRKPLRKLPRIHGFALAVWMALVASATFISEDLTCLSAGLIAARGRVGFVPAVAASAVGIFLSDLMLYAVGRLGRPWLGRAPLKWILDPEDLQRSRRWFEKKGSRVILLSRFLPGTRIPTYVTAGLLRMNALWFAVQLLIPVALWTPVLVGAAYVFGDKIFERFEAFERYAVPGFVGLLVTVWILLALIRSLATYRGRRLLVGWWKRKVHWEFWPLSVVYAPVVLYVLWLGLRRGAPAIFTAANPGIPAGGVIGESKSDILSRIDGKWVARYRRLEEGSAVERREAIRSFQKEHGLGYPVVLKPDRGERGAGVKIARSDDDVEVFLETVPGVAIVQEYIGGKELGVFYVRLPGDERGWIFAITDKVLPAVVGDGERTLERLILDDARAVAMAKTYFNAQSERLEEVPHAGEEVRLVDLGTHCRGAIFGDGDRFRTPELEDAVEAMSRSFDGFYFGRYDIRAPSGAAFREARDLKVLELNGVSSEATNIYDPKFGLRGAYRVLFAQWRLAVEVGARNRERGVRPLSVLEFFRLLLTSSR